MIENETLFPLNNMSEEETLIRMYVMVLLFVVLPVMMIVLSAFIVGLGIEYAVIGEVSPIGLFGVGITTIGLSVLVVFIDYLTDIIQEL